MTRAGRHVPRDREIRRRRAATRARVDADGRVRLRRRAHPVARGKIVVRRRGRHAPPGGTEANPGLVRGRDAVGGESVHRNVVVVSHGQARQHQGARAAEGLDVRGHGHREARIATEEATAGSHRGEVRDDRRVERARRTGAAHGAVDRRLQGTPISLAASSSCIALSSTAFIAHPTRVHRRATTDRSVNPRNTPSASTLPRAVRRHGRRQLTTFHPAPIPQVTQVKTEDKEGYTALQMGAGSKKAKRLSRQERGHFSSNELPFSAKLTEFRVSPDAILPVGTAINASHFAAGQHVDIQGHTIGKGFQGPMKRWGFSGLPASHGKFILIIVWAIRLMSCFVYRHDEEAPRARFHRQLAGSRSGLEREEDGGADG